MKMCIIFGNIIQINFTIRYTIINTDFFVHLQINKQNMKTITSTVPMTMKTVTLNDMMIIWEVESVIKKKMVLIEDSVANLRK